MRNTTETTILDDRAVSEIEARAENASPHYVVDWSKGEHALLQASGWRPVNEEQPRTIATFDKDEGYLDLLFCAEARTDIPALCATVRHLRAELADVRDELRVADDALENQSQWMSESRKQRNALQSQLEQLRAENERLKNGRLLLVSDLQSKLAQVEQERDRILQLYNSAWLWVQQRVKHPNSGLPPAAMTLIEMLPLLNQRVIQLCKDKAAEWEANDKAAMDVSGAHSKRVYAAHGLTKAEAARELADELEQL